MPTETKTTGLKKRQQIENASRTMFMWVAIASVAVSFCIVTTQFLFQTWTYNNKIISAKSKADDTLKKNIDNAKKLQDEVNALVGNKELAAVKTNPSDPNTKSVLDALPSKFDATALATSLQHAIVSRSSVTIESISVPTDEQAAAAANPQAAASGTATTTVSEESKPIEQRFSVTVSGSYDKIRNMVLDLERTIRPIKIVSISLNGTDASMRATVEAITYYQPAKKVIIKEEVVR